MLETTRERSDTLGSEDSAIDPTYEAQAIAALLQARTNIQAIKKVIGDTTQATKKASAHTQPSVQSIYTGIIAKRTTKYSLPSTKISAAITGAAIGSSAATAGDGAEHINTTAHTASGTQGELKPETTIYFDPINEDKIATNDDLPLLLNTDDAENYTNTLVEAQFNTPAPENTNAETTKKKDEVINPLVAQAIQSHITRFGVQRTFLSSAYELWNQVDALFECIRSGDNSKITFQQSFTEALTERRTTAQHEGASK